MKHFLFAPLIVLTIATVSSQDSLLLIPYVDEIIFDGRVDEAVWDDIPQVPLVQYEPTAGALPTEKTEIRFAHDGKYFYGSMRAYDSDPEGIQGNSLYRDRLVGSDYFEILLDPFNDNESAFIFGTNPSGIRSDVAITGDATGSGWWNGDFNTFWDAEVFVNEEGWFAEIRIPFSSLRFQDEDGKVIMGLIVQRRIARKVERLVFPSIPPKTNWAFLRPSLAKKIVMEGVIPTRTVYVSPYVLGGITSVSQLNEEQTAYTEKHNTQGDIGGEVKFSITNNLTMDFTVNTDFAQAEADDQLVNLTRFSLFYPEKRQFFQERAGIFNFRTGGQSRLFFSRRIGLSGTGQPLPIYGGVRLVGRLKTWDLGFLDMQTQKMGEMPSENFGVLRLRRRVFNKNSFAGAMVTSRLGVDGSRNIAYGIDGLFRLFGDDYLTVQWAQTHDNLDRVDHPTEHFNNGRLSLELSRRRREAFGYTVGTILSGSNYNPGLGFVDRNDFKFFTSVISHTWLHPSESSFIWQAVQISGNTYLSNQDNQVISAEVGPKWSFSSRSLDMGTVGIKWFYESLQEDFILTENVSVPVRDYSFVRLQTSYQMAFEKLARIGVKLETGRFYDGWLHNITLTPSWYASKHLEFSLEYSYNRADFTDRDQHFDIHIARLRVGTAINKKISTNALIQFNSDASVFVGNVRFRYNFREGNDLWIVLNQGINTERGRLYPRLPFSDNRSMLVKYLHTLQF